MKPNKHLHSVIHKLLEFEIEGIQGGLMMIIIIIIFFLRERGTLCFHLVVPFVFHMGLKEQTVG